MSEAIERSGLVPGTVRRDVTIPARDYTAFELMKGQVMRVVDVEGQQVGDISCFNLHNFSEVLSGPFSRTVERRWLLTTGHSLYSNCCNKMFTIVDDTCGVHDATGGYCREETNFARYGIKGSRNCLDNLAMATAPWGIKKNEIPGSFCVFMNMPYDPNGTMEIRLPTSKAGDYIDMRADMDLLVAISNCPQELNPCNAFNPSALRVIVFDPEFLL